MLNPALTAALAAIMISILLGWRMKINSGIIAMCFAFGIEIFLMDGTVSTVVAAWPSGIVFYLISISLFFNFATENGTLDLLSRKMLYRMQGHSRLIPWIITAVFASVAFLGAGASTPAIIGPLAFSVGLQAGLHPVLIALAVACATTIGGDNPLNGYGGVISKGLIEQTGYAAYAMRISLYIWINAAVKQLLVIGAACIILKGQRTTDAAMEKPGAFNPVQRKQLALIIASLAAMLVPMMLNTYFPSQLTRKVNAIAQPQAVMLLAGLLCVLLKLGDQQRAIEKIPMNTILLIAGMSMLLSISKEAGLVEVIAAVVTHAIPRALVAPALVLFAAFLSFFSSGTGVVCPLLYPIVENLSTQLSLNPIMLFSCIFVGAMSSSVSPFSTGGAMTIAGCPYRRVKDMLTNRLIFVAVLIPLACAAFAGLGLFGLLHL